MNVITIATKEDGPQGRGKLTSGHFQRIFFDVLSRHSITCHEFSLFEDLDNDRDLDREAPTVAILVYNEMSVLLDRTRPAMLLFEERVRSAFKGPLLVLHDMASAEIVGSKILTSLAFANKGIPVPKVIDGDNRAGRIFSNTMIGSGDKIIVSDDLHSLEEGRFNTEFIDTVHSVFGRNYYVSLRAMCVGKYCVNIYVRARPEDDGDASVHTGDTPTDPRVLNALYAMIVLPNQAKIAEICLKIGGVLGLGFYSHDILPTRAGELFVCETGFKFDDRAMRTRLSDYRDKVTFATSLDCLETEQAAQAFLLSLTDLGYPVSGFGC